jgi:hypothetical protein
MDRRLLGWILAAAGVVLVLVSAFADQLRLGAQDGFGWRQTAGIVGGIALAGIGALVVRRAGGRTASDGS